VSVVVSELEDASWHRLSPRMLLIHPVIEIGRALPALVGVFLAGSAQGNGAYWSLIGAGVVAVLSLSRWFTTRLRVTPVQVQLRHGLLRRRTITTARDRIRTVDVTSHLLHRMLGLTRVVVGTGTNDRKGAGRIVLDGLTIQAANTLRDDLLHRSTVDVTKPASSADSGPLPLVELDRRWIRYAPFTLSGVVTGLVIYGFFWRIQGESGVNLTRRGPFRAVADALDRMQTTAAVLVVLGALIVFVAVTSTIGYILAFWNFRILRHAGGTLQVTRGLITTRATSIERRRLVGTQISEALLLRSVGAARTLAIATGLRVGRGSERGGEVLLPPAPRAESERVAALVLDGTPAVTATLRAHSANARRRHLTRAIASALIILAGSLLIWLAGASVWFLVIGGAVLVVSVPVGLDRYRSLGHALVDGYLVTRFGSLVRRRAVLGCTAVIGWNMKSTFFQRRLGLTTLTATTAAGRQGYSVWDIDPHDGLALADAVTPGLLSPFRREPPATSR
jgi:putative membrane protein